MNFFKWTAVSTFLLFSLAISATESDQLFLAKSFASMDQWWKNPQFGVTKEMIRISSSEPIFKSYYPLLQNLSKLSTNDKKEWATECTTLLQVRPKDPLEDYLIQAGSLKCLERTTLLTGLDYENPLFVTLSSRLFTALLNKSRQESLSYLIKGKLRYTREWPKLKVALQTNYEKFQKTHPEKIEYTALSLLLMPAENRYLADQHEQLIKTLLSSIDKNTATSDQLDEYIGFISDHKRELIFEDIIKKSKALVRSYTMTKQLKPVEKVVASLKGILPKSYNAKVDGLMIWPLLYLGEKEKALLYIKSNNLLSNYYNLGINSQFWIAYTLKKNGDKKMSDRLFKNIIEKNPLNYYATLAALETDFRPQPKGSSPSMTPQLFSKKYHQVLERLPLWSKASATTLLSLETRFLLMPFENSLITSHPSLRKFALSDIHQNIVENIFSSMQMSETQITLTNLFTRWNRRTTLDLSPTLLSSLFPLSYQSALTKANTSLDRGLILSLIKQESSFTPNAKSHVGARGLMQLMPQTARSYRRIASSDELYKTDLNVKIGTLHLEKLRTRYQNNLIWMLSAYNAGEGNADKWIKKFAGVQDPYLMIEAIPFKETRGYVQSILRNYYFYSLLEDAYKAENAKKKVRAGMGLVAKL